MPETHDAVRERSWNMDLLIAVGTTTAFGYSIAALALPSVLPHDYYFDASSLIITLILTGNYLEHLTRTRAGSALRRLHRARSRDGERSVRGEGDDPFRSAKSWWATASGSIQEPVPRDGVDPRRADERGRVATHRGIDPFSKRTRERVLAAQ